MSRGLQAVIAILGVVDLSKRRRAGVGDLGRAARTFETQMEPGPLLAGVGEDVA